MSRHSISIPPTSLPSRQGKAKGLLFRDGSGVSALANDRGDDEARLGAEIDRRCRAAYAGHSGDIDPRSIRPSEAMEWSPMGECFPAKG